MDVTDTNFGQTVLTKQLAGTFKFACLDDVLYTNFWGAVVPASGEIKPMAYLFTLNFDGRIEEDRGLQAMDQSSVASTLAGKALTRTLTD
ncbi:hypothetical protein CR152_25485 [Massilia violaceinigra]|uniref:Uncharacterized protein n=1 Tax=Massilia violaceinigra TaxID=2045208 RepID=A0A2D2DR71_9BURK|nr:hypothetical protein CR152_25485 [Massilia violaceinigra]